MFEQYFDTMCEPTTFDMALEPDIEAVRDPTYRTVYEQNLNAAHEHINQNACEPYFEVAHDQSTDPVTFIPRRAPLQPLVLGGDDLSCSPLDPFGGLVPNLTPISSVLSETDPGRLDAFSPQMRGMAGPIDPLLSPGSVLKAYSRFGVDNPPTTYLQWSNGEFC